MRLRQFRLATPLWRALEENIDRLKPRLVILDALADLFGGEENFRRHARDFIVLLKRLAHRNRLAVILIAHPSIVGMNSGSGLSGSTDWHNGPRGRLYVETPLGDDRKPIDAKNRTLTVKKAQHSDAEGTVYKLRWEKGAYQYMGREGGSAPYDKAAAFSKADRVFLALLSAYEDQGRTVSPSSGANYAPKVFSEDEDAEGVRKEAFGKALGRLSAPAIEALVLLRRSACSLRNSLRGRRHRRDLLLGNGDRRSACFPARRTDTLGSDSPDRRRPDRRSLGFPCVQTIRSTGPPFRRSKGRERLRIFDALVE